MKKRTESIFIFILCTAGVVFLLCLYTYFSGATIRVAGYRFSYDFIARDADLTEDMFESIRIGDTLDSVEARFGAPNGHPVTEVILNNVYYRLGLNRYIVILTCNDENDTPLVSGIYLASSSKILHWLSLEGSIG